jgi:thioredoxin:protein disulfide reductase
VKATGQAVEIKRNESIDAIVEVKIDSGYHVNANPPTFSYLKATALELAPASGISVNFIVYPNAITKSFAFAEKPLAVYEGTTIIKVNLKADKSATTGSQNLSGKLRVQACDDQVCYAPGTLDVSIPLNIK